MIELKLLLENLTAIQQISIGNYFDSFLIVCCFLSNNRPKCDVSSMSNVRFAAIFSLI